MLHSYINLQKDALTKNVFSGKSRKFSRSRKFSQRIIKNKMETEHSKSKSIHEPHGWGRGKGGKQYTRSHQSSKHGNIAGYDGDKMTFIKSPVVPFIVHGEDNTKPQNMIMSASKRDSKFTIYEPVVSTPKMISKSEDDEFIRKLGQRNSTVEYSPKIASPVEHSPRSTREYFSPTHSYKSLSPRSESGNIDYDQFYKPRTREYTMPQQSKTKDNEVIELLKQQLEDNRRLLDAFIEREKRKEQTPNKNEHTESRKPKAVYSMPKESPVEPETNKTPDYESMDRDEIQKYEAKFRSNFKLLRESYPEWDIEVPEIGVISLRAVHEIYEELVNNIIIFQNAMKYRVILVIIFAGVEYYFYKVQKIRAFKNFCKVQIKSLSKYNVYLLNLSKSMHKRGAENEWPSWLNFVTNILTSLFSFVAIQGAANSMGWTAPESILHEADKFVSPDHGPAKLKSDGIPEVPKVPTGFQDPNYIIQTGLDMYEGIEEMNQAQAEPVNAKPVPKAAEIKKYDQVFD